MRKDLIEYHFGHGTDAVIDEIHGIIKNIAEEFKRLVETLDKETFNHFFLNKGSIKIDTDEYAILEGNDIIKKEYNGEYISNVMCHKNLINIEDKNWYIITDWPDIKPDIKYPGKDMVFPIHYESIHLCNTLIGDLTVENKTVLDVFSGSGIIGIYAALNGATSVHFIESNPRALTFILFNWIINMNNYNTCKFNIIRSNIFEEIKYKDTKYDLILANPPFEPVPITMEGYYFTHSFGGSDGQFYLEKFLNESHNYLNEKGYIVGVDFSPGRGQTEKGRRYRLKDILKLSKDKFDSEPIVLGQCKITEFASRYIALGIDIEHYQGWLLNSQAHNYHDLFYCWFVCGTNISAIRNLIENNDLTFRQANAFNWSNPLYWNYPCGITNDNKLQWLYLEDSFFIRESLYYNQLKNEHLLSHGENATYLSSLD